MNMASSSKGLLVIFLLLFSIIHALPEQGVWNFNMNKDLKIIGVTKSLYNNSDVSLKILCDSKDNDVDLFIQWVLRWSPCAREYAGVEENNMALEQYFEVPEFNPYGSESEYQFVHYQKSEVEKINCGVEGVIPLMDLSNEGYTRKKAVLPMGNNKNNSRTTAEAKSKGSESPSESRKKRQAEEKAQKAGDNNAPKPTTAATTTVSPKGKLHPGPKIDHPVVARTWEDGMFLFILKLEPAIENSNYNTSVTIWMKGPHGYLSASEWPLLPFYGTMCIVYLVFGLVWLVFIACNWRDLLRIQFWIGGVIFLGMLEKAVFFAEYESINSSGLSVRGAVVFAELISCLKRTVARMLVIIVSLGFGIVKPRLGPMLHRVLAAGALYFILGSIEGCMRVLRAKGDTSNQILLAGIPLAVLDAAICWWIFTSLVQTTRTLRLRRNLVKLSLYRHFTNTLIFTVLASVVFMIWAIKQHKLTSCITDWKELWVDDAFWHLLFSVMLAVIMILWRPTNNNNRYAFSPLLDAADDEDLEEEEPMMNDAFEGMKLRGGKTKVEYPDSPARDAKNKAEEDLKWIEENIPSSVADTALPSLLDSDEEIMTTKFEMSKME